MYAPEVSVFRCVFGSFDTPVGDHEPFLCVSLSTVWVFVQPELLCILESGMLSLCG